MEIKLQLLLTNQEINYATPTPAGNIFSVPQKDSHSHSRSQAQTRYITNYTKGHK